MIYFLITIVLLTLILRYDINEKKKYCNFCYNIVMLVLILVAGLRWRVGADQPNAMEAFYKIPYLGDLSSEYFEIGRKPLYFLLLSAVKTLGGHFYIVQLIQASFVNILIFRYFKKHTIYIYSCVFLYFIYMYTWLNMEEMKAGFSVAICLFANDYLLEKKWVKAYILYLLGVLFHPSTLLLLMTPLFLWLRMDLKGLATLFVCFIIGYIVQRLIGDYLVIFDELGDGSIAKKANEYGSSEQYMGQGYGILGVFVRIVLLVIYSVICVSLLKIRQPETRVLRLESFLMIGICCYILQMNIQIFYRYTHFYAFYCILFFSEAFAYTIRCGGTKLSRQVSNLRALFAFSPLIVGLFLMLYLRSVRYYPYSSVMDKTTYKQREQLYLDADRPLPNDNFY